MLVRTLIVCVAIAGCGSHRGTSVPQPTPIPYSPPQPREALELSYHGGDVLHNTKLKPIFWGTSWTTDENYTGIQQFLGGLASSNYLSISAEYADKTGSTTDPGGVFNNDPLWDNTEAPILANDPNPLADEACRLTGYTPDSNTIYIFYMDTPSSSTADCAWHSYFECNSSNGSQYSATMVYIPNTDEMKDCIMSDTSSGHSQRLGMMANLSAHEISESITNPYSDGWYDEESSSICPSGQQCEIGDKCAWIFAHNEDGSDKLVPLSNGTEWKLQTEWSNKAYEAGTGIPNALSQYGCTDTP